jgi:hypothetical protein
LLRGEFEEEMALARHAGDDERVAVDAAEEIWLRGETGAEVSCVGGLFGDCVATAGSAVSWKQGGGKATLREG